MALKRGHTGEAVKTLQRGLNKLGSLLLVDGDFGSSTAAAVADAHEVLKIPGGGEADDALLDALAGIEEPSRELTGPGVVFIGREEVSSPGAYRTKYKHPVAPPRPSGITIGIGYDLRFVDPAKLRADWDMLPEGVLERLAEVTGKEGSPELLARVSDIEILLPHAVEVFLRRMLPEHIGNTRRIYPTLDELPPARRTALISLVFNRGNDLEGERRREMKRIQELLASGSLARVADELEAMTRLWNPATARGVIERRRREALMWRAGFPALQLD